MKLLRHSILVVIAIVLVLPAGVADPGVTVAQIEAPSIRITKKSCDNCSFPVFRKATATTTVPASGSKHRACSTRRRSRPGISTIRQLINSPKWKGSGYQFERGGLRALLPFCPVCSIDRANSDVEGRAGWEFTWSSTLECLVAPQTPAMASGTRHRWNAFGLNFPT